MNLAVFLTASLTIGAALILSLMVKIYGGRKPEYALSRIFLKRDETIRALQAMVVGTCTFAAGRIIALFHSLNLLPQSISLASNILTGEAFTICLIYAFYKMLRVMKPVKPRMVKEASKKQREADENI